MDTMETSDDYLIQIQKNMYEQEQKPLTKAEKQLLANRLEDEIGELIFRAATIEHEEPGFFVAHAKLLHLLDPGRSDERASRSYEDDYPEG